MTRPWIAEDIAARIAGRSWYHAIDLGQGVVTPGWSAAGAVWDNIRSARGRIDYAGKRVLDLASWDGMWAFEAERLGAAEVIATEVFPMAYENFMICREILGSRVMPFYNASIYNLWAALAPVVDRGAPEFDLFDVVQNLGVMYHLRDPLHALASVRSVTATGGTMLLETAVVLDEPRSFALLNGPDARRIYDDTSTWWAMTLPCLEEMLSATLFRQVSCDVLFQVERRTGRGSAAPR